MRRINSTILILSLGVSLGLLARWIHPPKDPNPLYRPERAFPNSDAGRSEGSSRIQVTPADSHPDSAHDPPKDTDAEEPRGDDSSTH